MSDFPSTRADALARWDAFLERAGMYARLRNGVEPGHPHVSRVSPALRVRLVTEDELAARALSRHAFREIEKLLQEIDWRRYWKGWLELRPSAWTRWRDRVWSSGESADPSIVERAAAVARGESGVAVMDLFARELLETGYMHNHARMWWASFWIHAERLPWELGAAHFYRHLLDADPASNTLSWRWVAGLQTRGKTYIVRRSNLEKHCAPGLLADREGLDRLADGAVQPRALRDDADLTPRTTAPLPVGVEEPSARWGLWIHGDDLVPESSEIGTLRPTAIAAFLADELTTRYELSALRLQHLENSLRDGLRRAEEHFVAPARLLRGPALSEGIAAWAEEERLEEVVALAPFVGPLADELPSLRRKLGEVGARLALCRRASDQALLPLARAGFFGFWKESRRRFPGAGDR